MDIIRDILLILHFIGFAVIIGGVLATIPQLKQGTAKLNKGILHGAWLMLITGLGLVGMVYARGFEPDNTKIAVKTLVLVAIIVLALMNRKKEQVSGGVIGAIGGLAVLNVCLAVIW